METIICIDYGTSMTKVAATVGRRMPFPIPLGQCEGDAVKEYPIDSSLLFAKDDHIYFGSRAVEKSLEPQRTPQPRLDSLKRRLTTGDIVELAGVTIPSLINGTGLKFSVADALALMFAHVLRLTHGYLRSSYDEDVLSQVSYRFTRPVFCAERAKWVDLHMAKAIATGLALEPQLGESYAGSIRATAARKLLDAVSKTSLGNTQISSEGLPEPIAAGILVLSQTPGRRFLSAIMDIGAGTTDIALFAGVQPNTRPTVDRVLTQGIPRSVTKAGDYIDDLLKKAIEDGAHGTLKPADKIGIDLRIRTWKEDIFKFQEAVPILPGGRKFARVLKHNFVKLQEFEDMQRELIDALFGVLRSAEKNLESFATLYGPPLHTPYTAIEIVPCGGGASLPVFEELARLYWESNPSRRRLGFEVHKPIPVIEGDYDESFPQLAVALGGALRDQPTVNGPRPNTR